jgi:hypothetical protein
MLSQEHDSDSQLTEWSFFDIVVFVGFKNSFNCDFHLDLSSPWACQLQNSADFEYQERLLLILPFFKTASTRPSAAEVLNQRLASP